MLRRRGAALRGADPAGRAGRRGERVGERPLIDWDRWRRTALELAAAASAHGDVPVGAVVLDADGTSIGQGYNRREVDGDPTAHAEIVALRMAAAARGEWRLTGCTLVVTLEPCTMCAGAIAAARVDRLVYGALDPKAGAVESLWDVLRDRRLNHRPEVRGGVLEAECSEVLRAFFAGHR